MKNEGKRDIFPCKTVCFQWLRCAIPDFIIASPKSQFLLIFGICEAYLSLILLKLSHIGRCERA